jgi:hypothetical protein
MRAYYRRVLGRLPRVFRETWELVGVVLDFIIAAVLLFNQPMAQAIAKQRGFSAWWFVAPLAVLLVYGVANSRPAKAWLLGLNAGVTAASSPSATDVLICPAYSALWIPAGSSGLGQLLACKGFLAQSGTSVTLLIAGETSSTRSTFGNGLVEQQDLLLVGRLKNRCQIPIAMNPAPTTTAIGSTAQLSRPPVLIQPAYGGRYSSPYAS